MGSPMAKKSKSLPRWRITLIKGTPAKFLSYIEDRRESGDSPSHAPRNCSQRAARPTSSTATRESCRFSVICELLGLPLADRPKFTAWAGGVTRVVGVIGFLSRIPNILAMKRYLER